MESRSPVWKNRPMTMPEDVIRRYVDGTAAPDGDTAAALAADDAVIELPDGRVLEGKEGARQFAAKHAETDGQTRSVSLTSLEARTPSRFVATLVVSNREVATDELLYSVEARAGRRRRRLDLVQSSALLTRWLRQDRPPPWRRAHTRSTTASPPPPPTARLSASAAAARP